MFHLQTFFRCTAVAGLFLVWGCGGNEEAEVSEPDSGTSARPSGRGACALLMQGEVDELFGTSVGAGADETLDDGSQICSWPDADNPGLLLQIGPRAGSIAASVDLGPGYRVEEVDGLSGAAAMAVQEANEEEGLGETITLMAVEAGEKTITISPFGLDIEPETPRFDRLKALTGEIAGRM